MYTVHVLGHLDGKLLHDMVNIFTYLIMSFSESILQSFVPIYLLLSLINTYTVHKSQELRLTKEFHVQRSKQDDS